MWLMPKFQRAMNRGLQIGLVVRRNFRRRHVLPFVLIPHSAAGNDGHGQFRSTKTPILHAGVIASFRLFSNSAVRRNFSARFCSCLARAVQVMVAGVAGLARRRRKPNPGCSTALNFVIDRLPMKTGIAAIISDRRPVVAAARSDAPAHTYPSGFSVALDRRGRTVPGAAG